jgi:hypothetical protein
VGFFCCLLNYKEEVEWKMGIDPKMCLRKSVGLGRAGSISFGALDEKLKRCLLFKIKY